MEASILDLRYKMKEVLRALARNELVKIYYHGKLKGTIYPSKNKNHKKVKDHPFCGMIQYEEESVEQTMNRLRDGRYAV